MHPHYGAAFHTYAHGCDPGLGAEDPQSSAAVLAAHMGCSLSGQTHERIRTTVRTDRKDGTAVCPGLEPLRTR